MFNKQVRIRIRMATAKRSSSRNTSSRTKSSGTDSRSTGRKPKSSSGSRTSRSKASTRSAAHKRTSTRGKSQTAQHSDNPSSTGHGKAKKEPAKQTSQCWPGYEPVPGKPRGAKGSCKPKAHQTAAEKKSDGMAAAASKLRKAGGNKARANHKG